MKSTEPVKGICVHNYNTKTYNLITPDTNS